MNHLFGLVGLFVWICLYMLDEAAWVEAHQLGFIITLWQCQMLPTITKLVTGKLPSKSMWVLEGGLGNQVVPSMVIRII